MNKNFCDKCGVSVESSLRFCPLCGKFVAEKETTTLSETKNTYPNVDMSYIYIVKWIKVVRSALLLVAILATVINLFFKTEVFWFPYILAALFALWRVCFYPFKEGKSHLASIPKTGLILGALIIFIDVYNASFLHTKLGWALCYAAPAVFLVTSVVSFILAIVKTSYEEELARGMILIDFVSILFFVWRLIWFDDLGGWPIFMSIVGTTTLICVLFIIKRKRLVKEFNRNFHI